MTVAYDEIQIRDHYAKYKDMVFRIAIIHVSNVEDAKDIIQEVFIRLMKHGPDFSEESHVKRWLIQVTKNLCYDTHRSIWSKRISIKEIEEQYYQNDHKGFEIMEAIMKLKEKFKLIIILYYYEGYNIREIAELLNRKESSVKMRLQKAKKLLRIELEEDK